MSWSHDVGWTNEGTQVQNDQGKGAQGENEELPQNVSKEAAT